MFDFGAWSRAGWAAHLGGEIPTGLERRLGESTLVSELRRRAVDGPHGSLIIDDHEITHTRLAGLMDGGAARLAQVGVAPGDRVVLSVPTSPELAVAYFSLLAAGAEIVLANPAATVDEIRFVVGDSGATIGVAGDSSAAVCSSAGLEVIDARGLMDLAGTGDGGGTAPGWSPSPSTVALLAYTSGTTGRPKAVPLAHSHLEASIRGAMWAWRWSPSDVVVHALPLFHQHGLSAVHASVLSGSSVVVRSRFEPADLSRSIETHHATVLFAVPAVWQRLLEADELRPWSDLRLATSGSAALPPEVFAAIEARLGMAPLERYGTTESGLDVSNLHDGPRRPGHVGLPLPGVELRLDGPDAGDPDSPEGEILLRGPQVFDGYRGSDGGPDQSGGWFRTGDVGRIEGGSLRIVGRLKEMITTGGLNVYPVEVENVLATHPAVAEVAVAGVPSERWGEEVTAFVVVAGDRELDPTDLMALAREKLSAYKCPKRVVQVEALPVNAMGKVMRTRLSRWSTGR